MKPIVAIVGRPNVGKSMLFNKLIGKRLSIVEDTPGVTRDRIYGETDWNGRSFILVDTGGIEPRTDDQILSFMRDQAQIAIENATVIIFLTDVRTGLTASDQEVANMLLRSGKPIVLAVNKMDSTGAPDPDFYEFYNLGLGDPIAVSAVHGHGTGDLLDACLQYFPPEEEEEEEDDAIKVAVIGKPNAGKSSLVNRILGEERVIVSNVAGTTRDAIDSYFENDQGRFVFIDTAGIRRKSKVEEDIEKYRLLYDPDFAKYYYSHGTGDVYNINSTVPSVIKGSAPKPLAFAPKMEKQTVREFDFTKSRRLRNAGIGLTVAGVVSTFAIGLPCYFTAESSYQYSYSYPYGGYYYYNQSAFDAGVAFMVIGSAAVAAGIPMWCVGSKRMKNADRDLNVSVGGTQTGLGLRFNF